MVDEVRSELWRCGTRGPANNLAFVDMCIRLHAPMHPRQNSVQSKDSLGFWLLLLFIRL
jgi:hypothetical protein